MSRQKLGQHFLRSQSILERIARAACPTREPVAVEIGPGRGALTAHLLERADRVIALEIDPVLADALREAYAGEPRLSVVEANALDADLGQWGPAVFAGNLPYYAATPLIERVLALGGMVKRGVFLIQKEVADRITAHPGSRDYGYLSVRTQLAAECETLFRVRPASFQPPPKVDSAVVRLLPRGGAPPDAAYLAFVARCFRQKRKTIRNNLAGAFPAAAIIRLREASARAEQLTLEQFAAMYRELAATG